MRNNTIGLALAIALGAGSAAHAHAGLKSATPAANGVVSPELKEMRLRFSEVVIPVFSGVDVTDAKGKAIQTGTPFNDAKYKNILVVPLKVALLPGKYQAVWHAVSADTHRVEGHYSFRVK